ncbi:unnamed protein product [Hyaloperonospora brassicae]|uniref:Uncharacterized protein n=1 Tax=Hyaloperonospora brassicae TaxID=162125 RepID=A0AAV0TMI6_HYABA|nr:unnamed protein product [Hyaloperonospora brassicae]
MWTTKTCRVRLALFALKYESTHWQCASSSVRGVGRGRSSACMAPVAEQQRQSLHMSQERNAVGHASVQVVLTSTPESPSQSVRKGCERSPFERPTAENERPTAENERPTAENERHATEKSRATPSSGSEGGEDTRFGCGVSVASVRAVSTAGASAGAKDDGEQQAEALVVESWPVDGYICVNTVRETMDELATGVEQAEAKEEKQCGSQRLVASDCKPDKDSQKHSNGLGTTDVGGDAEALSCGEARLASGTDVEALEKADERESTALPNVPEVVLETDVGAGVSREQVAEAVFDDGESRDVEMVVEDKLASCALYDHGRSLLPDSTAAVIELDRRSIHITEELDKIVACLVDDVVTCVNAMGSSDVAELATIPDSPLLPHLSADEAMELLDIYEGDDHVMLPAHSKNEDVAEEDEPSTHEYQWFDGDDDDGEEVAADIPSVFDVIAETTDDIFNETADDASGSNDKIAPTNSAQSLKESAVVCSDDSADTLVIASKSSSNSSSSHGSASSSSSYSGSSSSDSSSSGSLSAPPFVSSVGCRGNGHVGNGSKKRRAQEKSSPRKLIMHTKRKRVRSPELEKPIQMQHKPKWKFAQPIIPPEFAVFETDAADPILKGLYCVRNNRRACFYGTWGFGDEAFNNVESVSPFEYTSRARVPLSRRKDDKRPISGKYGGYFKLRQSKGALVKVQEGQLDLQFLPMPSDGEEEDEEEGAQCFERDGNGGDERAASGYIVLGKGKNQFGRFLIRGYLHPDSGRLTVKRRYLE